MKGRVLEATSKRTEQSWPDRGPGSVDEAGDEGGAPGGAAPYVIGRARLASSAARGGYVIPASKGASQALWRRPPLHRPRNSRGQPAKLGRFCAARMQKLGCLK